MATKGKFTYLLQTWDESTVTNFADEDPLEDMKIEESELSCETVLTRITLP